MAAVEMYDADGRTGRKFLEEMFEYSLCDECGGDVADHIAVQLNLGHYSGNQILWFAQCAAPSRRSRRSR